MTVFIAHAPADRQAAEALEKVIERRGQFAELDDGQTALRPVQRGDVLVLLVSNALTFATARLRLEQRALDAWAEGRLVVVKLDHGIPPVGLRDLPAIDASFEAQREFTWMKVAEAIREKLRTPVREGALLPDDGGEATSSGREYRSGFGTRSGALGWFVWPALAAPGLLAIAATASIWLANRIGPTPGTFADLIAGIDAFGVRYGLPAGATPWLFLGFGVLTIFIVGAFIARLVGAVFRRAPKTEAPSQPRSEAPTPKPSDAVFVSYASANRSAVMPVIEAVKQLGKRFWVDQQGIAAGDGWAGEIVRAIRSAPRVVVMCSKAAFESDHVKREIYLADRYKKQLLPVFIEQAEPPEDFEYFFAGVQMLKLFETPEAERPQALAQALGS
ncbi:MAG: toll/interleukin-1 receptor domain-containing protein [Hyphomonadaceae bacterium]|nr:toll/interleukin-1 receptor domain-containing protein [Hyphomonadaceae bacterium]